MPSILDVARAKLRELRNYAYGSPDAALPSTLPTLVQTGWNGVSGVTGLASTDRYTIVDVTGQSKFAWLMHPASPNGTVVVFHSGHVGDDPKDATTKSIDMVQDLLAANYRVLALSMPGIDLAGAGVTFNATVAGAVYEVTSDHSTLKSCPDAGMLRIFVDPVFIAINQLRTTYANCTVFMCGISGGGWTTAWAAALDTRISRSYPVAGCLPHDWMRVAGGNGDWEQWQGAPWHRLTGLDYHELWALALGTGRKQRVCFNNDDAEYTTADLPSYFFPCLQATLTAYDGDWNYTINTGAGSTEHAYTATIRTAILNDMAA